MKMFQNLATLLMILSILPKFGFSLTERIRIWRILPPFVQQESFETEEQIESVEDAFDSARDDFILAMGPERMAEMWQVRQDLVEMRQLVLANWETNGLMEPSALLAQAMVFEDRRTSNAAERIDNGREGVALLNRPISDFLYQSDILLNANESRQMLASMKGASGPVTVLLEDEAESEGGEEIFVNRRRKRRQAQTGRNFPRNQWDLSQPVPFVFDPKLAVNTQKLVRLAAQFWTEHTCLSFAENGPGTPRVRFFPGGGCYSQVGRAFRQAEQLISLGRGCEQFGIAAHEIGHTLGFFHGQARFDRDQFVNVVYSNLSPHMAGQFVKQSPEDNFNFGITYDYGSIMHYSDTDTSTNRVTMLAKERVYQHTMGNNVKPSFLDVLEMNLYYKCTDHCNPAGADCKNGGYRHPRNCSTCICPDGFGNFDCSGRAPAVFGAPSNCGATLEANEGDFQTLEGAVSAAAENGMADRHAQCWWHIRAPTGKRIQLRVKSVSGACSDGCFYGGTELKTRDFLRVGARICCRSDVRPLGIMYSNTELALVSVFSQFKTQRFSLQYRAVDASAVPRSGIADYDDVDGNSARLKDAKDVNAGGTGNGDNGTGKQPASDCKDIAGNCFRLCLLWQRICHRSAKTPIPRHLSLLHLCENGLYRALMGRQCAKSCMRCVGADNEADNKENGARSAANGDAKGSNDCGSRDHKSCPTWINNGFCQSRSYSLQIKKQICPRQCRLC